MTLKFETSLPSSGTYQYTLIETAWGPLGLVCGGEIVCRLLIGFSRPKSLEKEISKQYPEAQRDDRIQRGLQRDLVNYFRGKPVDFSCRVDLSRSSEFGRLVLKECSRIKPGRTVTYGQLAQKAGRPRAARAVGNIMAHNRVPLIIPCHRVTAASGGLGGYSALGGIVLKRRIIEFEGCKIR